MNNIFGNKKIYYVANARIPTERAHGIQIAKMCEAFLEKGIDVEIVAPQRSNAIKTDMQDFYSLREKVPVTKLLVLDTFVYGRLGFWIGSLSFMISSFLYLLTKKIKGEKFVIYTIDMDQFSFLLLPLVFESLAVEIHDAKEMNPFYKFLFSRAKLITVINSLIKESIVERFKVDKEKILVFPNGIDLDFFKDDGNREFLKSHGLSKEKKIVLYSGKFYGWKGISVLIEASKGLSDEIVVVIVGGTKEELMNTISMALPSNIVCVGYRPYVEMPKWLAVSDALVVLGTKENNYSFYYTSPMKLFEYMASRRPIIASNTPAIKQIVDDSEVSFYECDSHLSLRDSIVEVLGDQDLNSNRTEKAYSKAQSFSWSSRAEEILSKIF